MIMAGHIAGRKKKPKFNVPNLGFFKSVKSRWRKPRGTHNKKRMKAKFTGAMPRIGYRTPEKARSVHPTGKKEVLVRNMAELEVLKDQKVLVRLAGALGERKRKLMAEKAKAMALPIVNMQNNGKKPFEPKASKR
jgi:large subunit ribosomal protein L32e